MSDNPKEQNSPTENDLPQKLSNPAKRALAGAGITRLEHLTTYTTRQISQLHGIGPNALTQLREVLAARGWRFADDKE